MRLMGKSDSGVSERLLIAFFFVLLLFLSRQVPQIARSRCTPTTGASGFLASCSAYAVLDVAPARPWLTTGISPPKA